MMFRFAHPILFSLLAIIGAWCFFVLKKRPATLTHSMTSRLKVLAGSGGRFLHPLPLLLRTACLLLLILTAARPQLFNVSREITSPGVDIVLCLDTSGSMQAMDFQLDDKPVSRLTAVKKVVGDFIRKRETDRIALVVFGEEAFTQSPLTLDKGLLLGLVEQMEIGMAGDRTAIGSALAVAGKRLKDLKAKSRIVVLLTDGRHNAGSLIPEKAAEALKALGVKIYSIGVGGMGPAPFLVQDMFGPRVVYQRVDLDEETLKRVAQIGNGKYFRATDSQSLSEIYSLIDRQEKTEVKVKEFFHFKELYLVFLVPALVLLGLEITLRATLLRGIP